MTDFGVTMFATDYSTQPAAVARAVEDRGFESIFFPEHTHIPADRKTPWPGGPDLPKHDWHTHDPFVAMSAAPTVTERLKLAPGICLVTEHEPIALAKTVASLDLISGGPQILLGAQSRWAHKRMVEYADGWMPVYGRTDVIEGLAGLRQAAAAGREMATIELSVFGAPGEEQAVES